MTVCAPFSAPFLSLILYLPPAALTVPSSTLSFSLHLIVSDHNWKWAFGCEIHFDDPYQKWIAHGKAHILASVAHGEFFVLDVCSLFAGLNANRNILPLLPAFRHVIFCLTDFTPSVSFRVCTSMDAIFMQPSGATLCSLLQLLGACVEFILVGEKPLCSTVPVWKPLCFMFVWPEKKTISIRYI